MYATSTLVAKHWLLSLDICAGVASSLPTNTAAWEERGFIVIDGILGDSGDVTSGHRAPVVSITAYAVKREVAGLGIKPIPPIALANQIQESVIREGIKLSYSGAKRIALPSGYEDAWIHQAYQLSEPRIIPGDQGSYASYQMDLQIVWGHPSPIM